MARSVFHRLGLPASSSIGKCSSPGCGFSSGQRPPASRLDRTISTPSAALSSGAAPAARR